MISSNVSVLSHIAGFIYSEIGNLQFFEQ